ncbi:hypothetical protein, partial [Pseudomonas abietaniphila]|uniref:hypothetical protein n=1 Tax=Pseudomonas abietaniphila TaxID=89065 RepID=UPI000B24A5A5
AKPHEPSEPNKPTHRDLPGTGSKPDARGGSDTTEIDRTPRARSQGTIHAPATRHYLQIICKGLPDLFFAE